MQEPSRNKLINKLAPTGPLYQKLDHVMRVEAWEGSSLLLQIPAIVKVYRCQYFWILDSVIQEALIQFTLTSPYTCKLLDLSIRSGSKRLFEVGLVIERLEGDLEADIKQRAKQDNYYAEDELMNIGMCVGEALLYAKMRVSHT